MHHHSDQMDTTSSTMTNILKARHGDRVAEYALPPPVFVAMEGEFIDFDPDAGRLSARFPIRESQLNPYGSMQGGMIAAAVDNTLGPLSMLVAPPNVTRHLEMTYSRPVKLEMGYITVHARLVERQDRWLHFKADVRGPDGTRLAKAKATHWILKAMDKRSNLPPPEQDPIVQPPTEREERF